MDRKKVLIVDDDGPTRLSLVRLLASEAVEVQTAATLPEAKAHVSAETFDLVITDLHLKGRVDTEGFDIISMVKAQTPQTRVVLFTAYGSPEVEREARQRGADEYWEKTMLIPDLVDKIRALRIPVGRERS